MLPWWGGGKLLSGRGHEVTFWSDGNVLDPDLGESHISIQICKKVFGLFT